MTYMECRYVYGYQCDKPGCPATVEGIELPFWHGLRDYWAEALSQGWTKWNGRSQRTYCPDHGPSARTKMHLVHGVRHDLRRRDPS